MLIFRFCCSNAIAVILLLLLATDTISMSNKDAASVQQNLIDANGHYNQGNLDQALLLYRRCLEQEPNQSDCLCNLASLLVDTGDSEGAEVYYRRALEVTDFKHAGALYNLALLLQESSKERDLKDAKELYLKLIQIEPENAEAWANIGAVLHQLGELNLSIPSYIKAIELYSAGDSDQRGVLSSLHENVGRATLRLSEQMAGESDKKKGLVKRAIGFLETALQYNPDNEVYITSATYF